MYVKRPLNVQGHLGDKIYTNLLGCLRDLVQLFDTMIYSKFKEKAELVDIEDKSNVQCRIHDSSPLLSFYSNVNYTLILIH